MSSPFRPLENSEIGAFTRLPAKSCRRGRTVRSDRNRPGGSVACFLEARALDRQGDLPKSEVRVGRIVRGARKRRFGLS